MNDAIFFLKPSTDKRLYNELHNNFSCAASVFVPDVHAFNFT